MAQLTCMWSRNTINNSQLNLSQSQISNFYLLKSKKLNLEPEFGSIYWH